MSLENYMPALILVSGPSVIKVDS